MKNISPYIRVALDIYSPSGWVLPRRVIFDYELLYIKEGTVHITIADREYTGRPGDIFLFRPKVPHGLEVISSEPLRQPHVHFSLYTTEKSSQIPICFAPLERVPPEQLDYFEEDLLTGEYALPDYIHLDNTLQFEAMLFEIIKEYSAKLPRWELHAKALLTRLLVYLWRQVQAGECAGPNDDALLLAKQYLETHYAREITLTDIARIAGISRFYFTRLFKQAFRSTPMQYLSQIRLNKACELLKYTRLPVTSVAEAVGYKDCTVFIRAFRRENSLSPAAYRKKAYGQRE